MEKNVILQGDSLEILKTLPDNSIDCCVTSPPYYALRDYGTGTWVGGDPNCPHYRTSKASDKTATGHKRMQEAGSPVGDVIYKSVCPLCGAVREDKQLGLEETPEKYIEKMTEVFTEVYRVLKPEGTLWLNIGDSYWGGGWRGVSLSDHSGEAQKNHKGTHCGATMPLLKGVQGVYKPKDLIGIPWMLAFSLRNAGWYLRQDIIWHKPNPMPESVTDRCVRSHEYIFLFSKSKKYYFDHKAIQEEAVTKGSDTRNKRDVWSVSVKSCKEAHFATFPIELITPCILAGTPANGVVLDPFMGAGTTAVASLALGRNYLGIELNPQYIEIAHKRISKTVEQLTDDLL